MTGQGEVGLTDTSLATSNSFNKVVNVISMRFRNDLAYVLTVSRYSKKYNRTDVLYEYNLSAGDTVLDTSGYTLEHDDVLYAKSSITGTSYLIYSLP